MTIHKRAGESSSDAAVASVAIDRAISSGDFERAALWLLIEAVRTLERGSIDDLISELAGDPAHGATRSEATRSGARDDG